jgi:DNA-binding transcriptional LysR family regulator
MEFRQLRYFVAVAEEGNIGAAAKRLHVSQPPVTRQIQALERNLGVVLFLRTHRGVELTAAGVTFLEDARRLLDLARTSGERSMAAARGEVGELRVAYFGTSIFRTLPLLLKRFLVVAPSATVSLTQINKEAQIDALLTGAIHIGFSRFFPSHAGITIKNVAKERLFLASAKAHAAAMGKRCELAELRNEPLVLFPRGGRPSFADEVIGIFKRAGIEPHVATIAEDVNAAMALTIAGVGSSVVPESVATIEWPDIAFTELVGSRISVPVSCIYRTGEQAPVLTTFLELLKKGK